MTRPCSPASPDADGSARLRLATAVPIRVQIGAGAERIRLLGTSGAARIRLLGTPGPDGATGPQGEKGDQGEPGITILPTDTPINGGFF